LLRDVSTANLLALLWNPDEGEGAGPDSSATDMDEWYALSELTRTCNRAGAWPDGEGADMSSTTEAASPEGLRAALTEAMRAEPAVLLGYLFGSHARGQSAEGSDVDLAVLLREQADAGWGVPGRLGHACRRAVGDDRVDLLVLNRAPPELAFAVVAGGERLYEVDRATRVEFEARTLARHGDYLPFLDAQRREILDGRDYGTRVQRYRTSLGRTLRALGEIACAGGKAPG